MSWNCKLLIVASLLFVKTLVLTNAYREFDVNGVRTILSLENETVTIQCDADTQMAYCGFIHPTGKRYSVPGSDLIDGHCSKIINATTEDSGTWQCHIGKKSIGIEIHQKIFLRVVNQVAAVRANITAVHGKDVTLACATTRQFVPLIYCRFEPPQGEPFSINSDFTRANALLNKYYFPQNRSLDRGDCAVTIKNVKYDDVGVWTCGAGLDDGKEYTDVITLTVEGLYTLSTASASGGVIVGIVVIVICLAILGFAAWKKRGVFGRRRAAPEQIEVQELGSQVASLPRSPRASPKGTPGTGRVVPSVVIQSPSVSPESRSVD